MIEACTRAVLVFVRTAKLFGSAFFCQKPSPVPHPNLFITPAIVKTPDDYVIYRGQILLPFIQEVFDSTI